jgi:23S rRNA pseudouridine1911/1915/1917 synthase
MKYTIKKTADLLETVIEIYHGVSRQKAKQIVNHSEFIINGNKIENDPRQVLEAGQVIEIFKLGKGQKSNPLPNRNNPISIHFEDNFFIIALKPAGILSCNDLGQKGAKSFHKVLEAYILHRDEKKLRLWPVHRLDKEVEGFIIFAKNEKVHDMMKDNWQNVSKKYLALVENKPSEEHGFIENWLKEGREQKVFVSNNEIEGSKFAKTEFQYIQKEKKYHLIELTLYTGRKNQIRAHLSHIGCPIVGDRKYGADGSVNRQVRLCAYKIEFEHPVTNEKISLEYRPIARFFKPSNNEDENYKII